LPLSCKSRILRAYISSRHISLVQKLKEREGIDKPIFYSSFFLSKKDLRCHNCQPATPRHTRSDMIPNHATLEFVTSFRSRISASLQTIQHHMKNISAHLTAMKGHNYFKEFFVC
jgi:hypothetical protein